MQKSHEIEFKTLLTQDEYDMLVEKFKNKKIDLQTNHYFDTPRFSLKAHDASLRIRERDGLELTLKKKRGYAFQEYTLTIDLETFKFIKETGTLPDNEIKTEVSALIGTQKLVNFMSLSTERIYFPYQNGALFIDKSHYCGMTDYELEYEAKSYHSGKKEFIDLINEFGIQYKKSEKKIKRAYNAFKRMH